MTAELKTGRFGDRASPQQVLIDALDHADDMALVVVCNINKNGDICSSWSSAALTHRLGVLDVVKHRMIELARS